MRNATCVAAMVPELNVSISLEGAEGTSSAEMFEGTMFDPFYYISMAQNIRIGEESNIWLKIRKLPQQ